MADRHIRMERVFRQVFLQKSPMETQGGEGISSDNTDPIIQSSKLARNRKGNLYFSLLASLQLVVCWYKLVVELLAYQIAAHYGGEL